MEQRHVQCGGSCFEPLSETASLAVGVFRCSGSPRRSGVETTKHAEIVLPQTGAYIRHDATGSVCLDETVVGFFAPGRDYVIQHLDERPDVTTVLFLKEPVLDIVRGAHESARGAFARSAVRATAAVHFRHHALLDLSADPLADPLAVEESAVSLVSECIALTRERPELSEAVPSEGAFTEDVLMAVVDYIRANFRRRLTLAHVSNYAGYSPFHLCRAFRKRMHMTLFQYLEHVRLRAAYSALMETSEPVGSIALDHGFCSNAHLTARFVRWAGVPPSAVRRNRSAAARANSRN